MQKIEALLPESVKKKLATKAKKSGKSMSEIVRELVTSYVKA
jgi:plasmid stability protein